MKDSIELYLENREWGSGECYPFTDIEALTNEMGALFGSNGFEFVGIRPFGETLIIEGSTSYHINPTPTKEGFRITKRVRMNPNVDTNTNKN
jgi:hypothetical protein